MNESGLSQERIKFLACVTMLIDHVGAALYPTVLWMRVAGRIAFPIYCYLLSEGVHYTRNPAKYAFRLFVGLLLSEIPFDFAFWGRFNWEYQSVMFTLLIGLIALECISRTELVPLKLALLVPFFLLAEFLETDYGGWGVLMIAVFELTRDMAHRGWIRFILLGTLCGAMPGAYVLISRIRFPLELPAVLALIPIAFYNGKKETSSKLVQWAFYLFYPVHLATIAVIARL